MENNDGLLFSGHVNAKLSITKRPYDIMVMNDNGTKNRLRITDEGKLLYNEQPLNSLDDHENALKLLLKAICNLV